MTPRDHQSQEAVYLKIITDVIDDELDDEYRKVVITSRPRIEDALELKPQPLFEITKCIRSRPQIQAAVNYILCQNIVNFT